MKSPEFMLTVTCDDCKTQYVPDHINVGPMHQDPKEGPGRMVMEVRCFARCPACNALIQLLNRAGLRSVANHVAG